MVPAYRELRQLTTLRRFTADRPLTTRQRRSRVGFRADLNRTGNTGATRRAFDPTKLPGLGGLATVRF